MKIRQGFVSNSSSSSFIIAGQKNDTDDLTMTFTLDLSHLVSEVLKTKEDVLEYLDAGTEEEILTLSDGDGNRIRFEDMMDAINAGLVIYVGRTHDDDRHGIESFLCYDGFEYAKQTDDLYVIEGGGGY